MSLKLKILLLFVLVCFGGCKKESRLDHAQSKESITALIKNADNANLSLKERLDVAMKADSLSLLIDDKTEHLQSQKLIGTLYLKSGDLNLAFTYFERTVGLAKSLSDYETEGAAFNNLGIICNERSSYDSALQFYENANKIFRNKGYMSRLAQGLVNVGIVYKNQSNFDEAFKITLDAAKVFDSLNEKKDLAAAYTTLGNTLKNLNRLNEALGYHQLALQLRNAEKDSTGIPATLHNIANIYRIQGEYQKALVYYQSALAIKGKQGLSKTTGATVDNIGEVYFDLQEYDKAEYYFKKALNLRETNQDRDGVLTTSNKLTKLYLAKNEVENAKSIALKTLNSAPQRGFLQPRLDNALMLTEIYLQLKQYEAAAKYANLSLTLKDSLFNSEMGKTVSQLDIKYKTQQKEKELRLSKQLQAAQFNQIHVQQKFIALLTISILILSYLMFLLYRSNKAIKHANQKVEILMHELNHRVKNNLQIVSDMLHLQLDITTDEHQTTLMQSSINRVESMNIIHSLLYKEGFSGTIDMQNFAKALISNLAHTYQEKSYIFEISINIQNFICDIDKAIPLGLIINELITNIYKYAKPIREKTTLKIEITEENKKCKLKIIDNCKDWNIYEFQAKKSGLGLFLIETLINQINGNWVQISNEEGSAFYIEFNK